ncbi:MAG: glycosyltransferase [Bacteroidales bacterium]|nr:glycosyltransferase [Bacteroidales bacterium]
MKIFVLLPRIPYPLEKGDKLRAFNQIKQLAKNNEIVLCALNDNPKVNEQDAFRALQPYCQSVNFIKISKPQILLGLVRAFFKGLPMQTGYFYNRKAAKKINQLIERHRPDMLFGQLLRVAEYIRHKDVPKTIDYQDIFSYGMKRRADVASFVTRPIYNMEYRRLARYEAAIFNDFDVRTIISEPDRQLFPHPKRDEILIIPNGVDHEFFKPQECEKQYDLVFTGNMSYAPNVNAVEYLANEILPIVWKTLPDVKMYIAGATPDPRVKKYASERIIVSGWLDDIRTAYAQSRVFIAPMRIGTGLQNKLLEAMSMRLPAITSPLANASLGAKPEEEILVGSNAEEMAQHIITLLTDHEKAERLAQAGYDFTNRVYDWGKATEIMETAMKDAYPGFLRSSQ